MKGYKREAILETIMMLGECQIGREWEAKCGDRAHVIVDVATSDRSQTRRQ